MLADLENGVLEFLSALKPGARNVYGRGLKIFQQFYTSLGSVIDFLDRVEHDMLLPRRKRKRVAMGVLSSFAAWLQESGYAPKTVRAYVGAVQSLAKYYDVPISLRYVRLTPAQPVNKKHPWTLVEVGEFVAAMNKPAYRSIAASILQSGLSISGLLVLTYGDVKEELEKNIAHLCLDLTRKKTTIAL